MYYTKVRKGQVPFKVWKKEEIKSFLSTAFSDFKWRNVGLGVLLSYELAQPIRRLLEVQWSDVDLDKGTLEVIETGAVFPLTPTLKELLTRQKKDFRESRYVLPTVDPKGLDKSSPYAPKSFRAHFKVVLTKAGLNKELQLDGVKDTAIFELVEAGVPLVQVKAVTGHRDLKELHKYVVSGLTHSAYALSKRDTGI